MINTKTGRLVALCLALAILLSIFSVMPGSVSASNETCECVPGACDPVCAHDDCAGLGDALCPCPPAQPIFVPVTNIVNVPATATIGTPLNLTGTVVPPDATNQTITWEMVNEGTTGATLAGSTLNVTAAGTVIVRATVAGGLQSGDYTQDVSITVPEAATNFVAVTDITNGPASGTVGVPLTLTGTVVPPDATNKTITWSVENPGSTGAEISGNILSTQSAGTVTVRATIENGLVNGNYSKPFTITITQTGSTVTVNQPASGGGSATAQTGSGYPNPTISNVAAGATVTLTAAPPTGFVLTNWTVSSTHTPALVITRSTTNANVATFTMPSANVMVAPVFAQGYAVTISRNESWGTPGASITGVASASSITAASGTRVDLTTTINSGYTFQHWEVINPVEGVFTNGSITNRTSATGAHFTMPAAAVTVRAVYAQSQGHTVTVTRNNNAMGTATALISTAAEDTAAPTITAEPGQRINLTAAPAAGADSVFVHWEVVNPAADVFTDAGITNRTSATEAHFTMPSRNVEVRAVFRSAALSASGVPVRYGLSGGTATLELPSEKVTEIITAVNAAGRSAASFDLREAPGATRADIPTAAFTLIANAGLGLEIVLPQGTLALNSAAVRSASSQAYSANIEASLFERAPASLNVEQRAEVRENDLVFSVTMSSGGQPVSSFEGTLSITVPYSGQLPVAAWRLSARGELEEVESAYNSASRAVTFSVGRLSEFVVGMDNRSAPPAANPFIDVFPNDWFFEDVLFANNNGLMRGTTTTQFEPRINLNRAMVVTILYRQAGEPAGAHLSNPFSDVPPGEWYTVAVQWASANGIVLGDAGRFRPDDDITRQDFAVILHRYMTGYLQAAPPMTLPWGDFSDRGDIADYAITAMEALNRLGIIRGDANMINPRGNASRAEAAAMLHRFVLLLR